MALAFCIGFLLGALALVAVEAAALYWAIALLRRKTFPASDSVAPDGPRDVSGNGITLGPIRKQGFVWVLEPEKVPKIGSDGLFAGGSRDGKRQNAVEVSAAKKYGKIKDHMLVLIGLDGSQASIELPKCTVLAISASSEPSRKWAKRFPIMIESKEFEIYRGSNVCYMFCDTSWEKESWCRALQLASTRDESKRIQVARLGEEFRNYAASLSTEYPSFLKPVLLPSESVGRVNRADGSSKVRDFLKKLAKKASTKATPGESKSVSNKRAYERVQSVPDGPVESQDEKSSSNSLEDHVTSDDKLPVDDEGTLCWNLLLSRLFFDVRLSDDINSFIKARIQRTLSNMRIPSYVGEITLSGFEIGTLPPHICKMRVVPTDLNELWAFEVDFEYSGGMLLELGTRLEVREPELQKDLMTTAPEDPNDDTMASDLLESIEHYGNQFKSSQEIADGSRHSKGIVGWKANWKNMLHAVADQVSQVPLSLTMRIMSVHGTLRIHVKAPPSDRLWYGFCSPPDIEWNIETSVGDRRITGNRVASLVGNRVKTSIRNNVVLPNCESIAVPWMAADKDDWAPCKAAPFIWLNQESSDSSTKEQTEQVAKPTQEPVEQPPEPTTTSGELLRPLLLTTDEPDEANGVSCTAANPTTRAIIAAVEDQPVGPRGDDLQRRLSRRAKVIDFGKRMGDKLEEKRRHIEEKSRHIVEKMRENSRT